MQASISCTLHPPCFTSSRPRCSPPLSHRLRQRLEQSPVQTGLLQDRHLCRAEGPRPTPTDPAEQTPQEEVAERLSEVTSKKLAPGQATAIVTGGVSIAIGIGYLVLAYFLDQRGGGA